jgi:peptidyl-dipeptidase Dcp
MVECTACALVDLDLHLWPESDDLDFGAYEATSPAPIGMPDLVVMRYRPPHFVQLFSGGGYASGDYSHMCSTPATGFGRSSIRATRSSPPSPGA